MENNNKAKNDLQKDALSHAKKQGGWGDVSKDEPPAEQQQFGLALCFRNDAGVVKITA